MISFRHVSNVNIGTIQWKELTWLLPGSGRGHELKGKLRIVEVEHNVFWSSSTVFYHHQQFIMIISNKTSKLSATTIHHDHCHLPLKPIQKANNSLQMPIVVCDSRQLSTEGNWSNLAQFWRSNWIPLSQFRITLRLIVRLFKAFGSKD